MIANSLNSVETDNADEASSFINAIRLLTKIKMDHNLKKSISEEVKEELKAYYRSVFPFADTRLGGIISDLSSPTYRKIYQAYLGIRAYAS